MEQVHNGGHRQPEASDTVEDKGLRSLRQVGRSAAQGQEEDGVGIREAQVGQHKVRTGLFCYGALEKGRGLQNALHIFFVDANFAAFFS